MEGILNTLAGRLLAWLVLVLLNGSAWAVNISAARLWPSPDYTRITLESDAPITFKFFSLANPDRLVIDLEGVEPNAASAEDGSYPLARPSSSTPMPPSCRPSPRSPLTSTTS